MNPLRTHVPSRDVLLVSAAASAIAGAAAIFQNWPRPLWAWLWLSLVYLVIEAQAPGRVGAGWIAAIAMAAALSPRGALLAAAFAAAASGVIDVRSGRAGQVVAGRIAAHVPPVAAFIAVAGAGQRSTWIVVVGAGIAGAVAIGIGSIVCRLAGELPHNTDARPSAAEAVMLGMVGGLLGLIGHSVGWPAAPIIAAGLLIAASAETGRRSADEARHATIATLMAVIESKDVYTRGHSERVAAYCGWIGAELGLKAGELRRLHTAALLHDIGKLVVPRRVLRKRGPLTGEERAHITRHATVVPELLEGVDVAAPALPLIADHHLHFGGGGYGVNNATGYALPVAARILAVADAFDAMTTHRPYRSALSVDYAVGELRRCAGTQFDPLVVSAFGRCLARVQPPTPAGGFVSEEAARRQAEGAALHV